MSRYTLCLVLAIFPSLGISSVDAQVNWFKLPMSGSPSARCCSGMAFDTATGLTVLFGGFTPFTYYGDTWTWDGNSKAWTQQTPLSSPPAREGPGMAYDDATQTVVLFGGTNGTDLNDTWIWDGKTWTQQFPPVAPSGRRFDTQGMTYDAATRTVVLFGGIDSAQNVLADTWIWDGIAMTWTQYSPLVSPSPRRAPLAYDEVTKQVVLFGGDDPNNGKYFADTWTWDGTNWTQQFPTTAPPARGLASTAYDRTLQLVVLFGGAGPNTFFADTWSWDGNIWVKRNPHNVPPDRYAAAISFDDIAEDVMLFGGFSSGPARGDTWILTRK